MPITNRLRIFILVAIGALIGAVLCAPPSQGAAFTVSGTVRSGNGPVTSGMVFFFATCHDYNDNTYAGMDAFDHGTYSVTVPSGTYVVGIAPGEGTGALLSFHSAKSSCSEADLVSVTGNTTLDLIASAEWFDVSGSVASGKGPINQASVYFYASCEDFAAQQDVDHDSSLDYGTYQVTVPAGAYRVLIRPWSGGQVVMSWHDAKMTCEQATPVVVNADSLINLNAAALYTVTGSAHSASGVVSSGSVGAYTDCQAFATKTRTDGGTLSGGAFSVDLPPGTYLFYARVSNPPTTVTSWHGPSMTCEKAIPVTITGDTVLDLTLMGIQRVKRPAPKGLKLGHHKALAKRTKQGARVTWKVLTPKVCSVKKFSLSGRKGKRQCKVRATAPETGGYAPFSELFWVQVYKPST
jgi:hypothetical protein